MSKSIVMCQQCACACLSIPGPYIVRFLRACTFIALTLLLLSHNDIALCASFFPERSDNPSINAEQRYAIEAMLAHDVKIDSEGRRYVLLDDQMFLADPLPNAGFVGNKWSNAVLSYEFSSEITAAQRTAFRYFKQDWENVSGLRIVENPAASNRIRIVRATDPNICGSSYVGMIGGVQTFTVGDSCWTRRTITHELGHALGMAHEHQRSDRNTYLDVYMSNVCPGYESNFTIAGTANLTPYDYRSVMHYSQTAFGKPMVGGSCQQSSVTMQPKEPHGSPSDPLQNSQVSILDGEGMAARYGFRVEITRSGPAGISVAFSGASGVSCGPTCMLRTPGLGGTVTVSGTGGAQIVALLGNSCSDNRCAFSARRNATFVAVTVVLQKNLSGATLVSRSMSAAANRDVYSAVGSRDGRYIAFDTKATNFALGDSDEEPSVYLWDNRIGILRPISVTASGVFTYGRSPTFAPGDGAIDYRTEKGYVRAYLDERSSVERLVGNDYPYVRVAAAPISGRFAHQGGTDVPVTPPLGIYLTTGLVSSASDIRVDLDFTGSNSQAVSQLNAMDPNGAFVGFSSAGVLTPEIGPANTQMNAFLRDVSGQSTTLLSRSLNGTGGNGLSLVCAITPGGRYILFLSGASNLVAFDSNAKNDLFIYDRNAGFPKIATVSKDGTPANNESFCGDISRDGRYIVFQSDATNLVGGYPASASRQVYVKDLLTGLVALASVVGSATMNAPVGTLGSAFARFSEDAGRIYFTTNATNLDPLATSAAVFNAYTAINPFKDLLFVDGLEQLGDPAAQRIDDDM